VQLQTSLTVVVSARLSHQRNPCQPKQNREEGNGKAHAEIVPEADMDIRFRGLYDDDVGQRTGDG
jgi:hypothetical protein